MTTTIAVYATDTMADWEYAYLTAEAARAVQLRPDHIAVRFVGDGTESVRSLGGMTVEPSLDLAELTALPELAALVIPGGDTYFTGHERLLATVSALLERDIPVAAICGATFLLARGGHLDERAHTSNAPEFLAYSGYGGGEHYVAAPVVTDRGVTTATGLRPIEFTAEVMRLTDLYPKDLADTWERLNHTADPADYRALMEATDAFAQS